MLPPAPILGKRVVRMKLWISRRVGAKPLMSERGSPGIRQRKPKLDRLWGGRGVTGGRTKPLRGIGTWGWHSAPNSALLFV